MPPKKGIKRKDKRNGVKREFYHIPDKLDLEIWKAEFDKLSKSLDAEGFRKPVSEKEIVGWVRKKLDDVWMKCPTKLAFLEKRREPDYSPDTRRQSKWTCDLCKNSFSRDEVQVDHIEGEHEFTKLEQLQEFANKRFMVGYKDLQILCVPCHELKTHAERHGITLEDAKIEKKAIQLEKDKQDKDYILAKGETPAKNAKLRREQLVKLLLGETNGQ